MSYEIREMSFGEILDMGFRLLRNHFVLLVGIAAVFYVPFGLVVNSLVDPATGAPPTPEQVLVLIVLGLVAFAVINPVVFAAITHALGESYLGRSTGIGDGLRVGFSILLPLVGTSLLAVLAELVGFVLLIIPGIYLALAFLVLQQVMVLERRFGFAALSRSHELMKGHKARGFGIMLVSYILVGVVTAGVGLLTAIFPVPVVGTVVDALAQSVGYAFLSAVLVVLYFDIRCRKESFDLEHLASLVEEEATGAPAPIG